MSKQQRFQLVRDGLTTRPRFSRRWAVIDTKRLGQDGLPIAVIETDDVRRALSFAGELNAEQAA